MGTVNDIVILERNKENGDLNIEHLTEQLREQLNLRSCTVDSVKLDNESSQHISQIVQRVAWADDLDDAINAVKSFKEQMALQKPEASIHETRSRNIFSTSASRYEYASCSSTSQYLESFSPLTTETLPQNLQNMSSTYTSRSSCSFFASIPSTSEGASFSSSYSIKEKQDLQIPQLMEPSLKTSKRGRKRKAQFNTTTQAKCQKDSQSTDNTSFVITSAKRQRVDIDVARRMLRRQITRKAYYQRILYK